MYITHNKVLHGQTLVYWQLKHCGNHSFFSKPLGGAGRVLASYVGYKWASYAHLQDITFVNYDMCTCDEGLGVRLLDYIVAIV